MGIPVGAALLAPTVCVCVCVPQVNKPQHFLGQSFCRQFNSLQTKQEVARRPVFTRGKRRAKCLPFKMNCLLKGNRTIEL